MDLNQIEQWTRQALEAEAIRRGIRDPHLRTTRELIRTILRQEFGMPIARSRQRMARGLRLLDQARGFFDAATVVAAALWPAHLRNRPSSLPAEPAEGEPATQSEGLHPAPSEPELRVVTGERLPRPALETLPMARTLAAQGQRARALEIYDALIARNALDPVPRTEAAALRAGEPAVWAERVERVRAADVPEGLALASDGDRIEWEHSAGGGWSIRWRVTAAGEERARAALGEAGRRVVQLVSIGADASKFVRSEVQEHAPVEAEGGMHIAAPPNASRFHVAVGLRGAQRFVPITYASLPGG